MQPLSSTVRTHNLATLNNGRFDVLVIGGGVTGAGVALDAATRGYKVALVEKLDFASGTSSKATKLVHGGIRYLSNFDFVMVHEALVERGLLLQNAPFLVHPLAFVLPMYKGDSHPVGMPFTTPGGVGLRWVLNIGLWLYDVMAGRRNIHKHYHMSRSEVLKQAPALLPDGLKEGFVYYDAQTNDARLTMALICTAAQYGAIVANYTEVTSFLTERGKVQGVRVRDRLDDQALTIYARHIVNATGVFSEQVEELTGTEPQVQVEPSKGVHLVFSCEDVQLRDMAIVLPETDDRRIIFIVPWESRAIVGTTDTGTGDLDQPSATRDDVLYLLHHLNRYLSVHLTEENIISAFAGYRPLLRPRNTNQSTARLSRSHSVLESPSGLVSIVGGKLTTYRRMAQDTVDVLCRRDGSALVHPTQNLPLRGSAGWPAAQRELEIKGAKLGLDRQVLAHLGRSYGSEAEAILSLIDGDASLGMRLVEDLPYIRAEVLYACRQEMAMTPYDVLARRTSLTLEDRQRGLGVLHEVAVLMAKEHNWTPEQESAMVDDFRDAMQRQMAAEALAAAAVIREHVT